MIVRLVILMERNHLPMKSNPLVCLLSLILLLLAFTACSPEKKVQRYSYLFDQRKPAARPHGVAAPAPAPSSRPVSAASSNTLTIEDNHSEKTTATPSSELANKQIDRVIKTARSYIGTQYKYGGMSRKGIDCSGLVCTAYSSVNRELPRSSSQLAQSGSEVARKKVQPGDLVFFSAKNGGRIDHVGLITGVRGSNVEFIHATTSNGVRTDLLNDGYWDKRFRKAVRP
jgi:cell wall-associated NlpC family hydrolase